MNKHDVIEAVELCERLEGDSEAVTRYSKVEWPATNDMKRGAALIRSLVGEVQRLTDVAIHLDYLWHGHPAEDKMHRDDCSICAMMYGPPPDKASDAKPERSEAPHAS